MTLPQIAFIPLRPVVASDRATTLDVLLRITPPQLEVQPARPSLNLGFVIDRSGSMTGKKIDYARQAVCYAIEQLLASDRISITIFDDRVQPLVANTTANNKASLLRLVQQIQPGGSTALHSGWVQGGMQTSQNLSAQLNRVILLSDGLANVGETNPDTIANDVHGLAKRGVSTSTMGVGDDYDEDLLTAMANSGDGNYYYIASPEQLPTIFEQELQGLAATLGTIVRLNLEPQGDVVVADVLNDLTVDSQGRFQLPNLVAGSPQEVVLRLKVPAMAQAGDLLRVRLSWQDKAKQLQEVESSFRLPGVPFSQLEEFPFNQEVQQQVALMMTARAKKEAVRLVDRGEMEAAGQVLQQAKADILSFNLPMSTPEAAALDDLNQELQQNRVASYRKMSEQQSYSRSRRRSSGHTNLRYAFRPILGDITQQRVDAIVNSTDQSLSKHGAISSAIHQAAGPELEVACQQLNGCAEGDAKATPGFNLPAKWVIHTVCPRWEGGNRGETQALAQCYENCLTMALMEGARSVAFPAIGIDALGFPVDVAARIAFETTGRFLFGTTAIGQVLLVCRDEKTLQVYQTEFERIAGWQ
ncbi:MAG: macro domain-containing protein [Leptolyngbyaceae cyanobacterium bins.59]|nr:macro domain-containing protein [Leptolyngbyaceae cyanobacterium bins.59]